MSVVIPACRAAHTISRPVDSLLAQTRLPDEILVIDDGSPDDLEAALSRYGDRVTLIRKSNGGAASARNLGIERSRGELIAFLGADDSGNPGNSSGNWKSSGLIRKSRWLQAGTTRNHPMASAPDRFPMRSPGIWDAFWPSAAKRRLR